MTRFFTILHFFGILVLSYGQSGIVGKLDPFVVNQIFQAAEETVEAREEEEIKNSVQAFDLGSNEISENEPDRSIVAQNAFSRASEGAKERQRDADVLLEAGRLIATKLGLPADSLVFVLPQIDVSQSRFTADCPFNNPPVCTERRFRTIDGTCNNLENPFFGAALTPQKRLRPADYSDGADELRAARDGGPLPNAREVTVNVHQTTRQLDEGITAFVFQWGQFLDHDITLTPITTDALGNELLCCDPNSRSFNNRECRPILFNNDPEFGDCNTCMNFARSLPSPRRDCKLGVREQLNQITAFLDASHIYGSEEEEASNLRSFQGGQLRTSPPRLTGGKPLLPTSEEEACNLPPEIGPCFVAGDERVNEQVGLTTQHTIWVREHNRIAAILQGLNPTLSDEAIYQETRRIVAAETQHITFNEFLPVVFGTNLVYNSDWVNFDLRLASSGFAVENGYDPNIDATIANEFSTAAYRFGHTLIPPDFMRISEKGNSPLPLRDTFLKPSVLFDNNTVGGTDPITIGMTRQLGEKADANIVDEVRNRLFQSMPNERLDLPALNIQRGRDHGIPGYNTYRNYCGLRRGRLIDDFIDEIDQEQINRLKAVYRNVDDVDLFAGGLSERPVGGGLVGPTFACIIGKQFDELRRGDRFWYENGGFLSSFTLEQLEEIRKVTLAKILCDNGDSIREIQPDVFRPPTPEQNNIVSCSSLPQVNIQNFWRRLRDF